MGKLLQSQNALPARPAAGAPAPGGEPVTAEALGWQLRAALPPMRLHSVSIYDSQANVLWLSEGALGPDEHSLVLDALEALGADSGKSCCENGLEDGRIAAFLAIRAPQGHLVGLAMILADFKSGGEGWIDRIMSATTRTVMQKLAVLLKPAGPRKADADPTALVLSLATTDVAAAEPEAQALATPVPPQAPAQSQARAPSQARAASQARAPSQAAPRNPTQARVPTQAAAAPKAAPAGAADEELSPRAVNDILEFELTDEPLVLPTRQAANGSRGSAAPAQPAPAPASVTNGHSRPIAHASPADSGISLTFDPAPAADVDTSGMLSPSAPADSGIALTFDPAAAVAERETSRTLSASAPADSGASRARSPSAPVDSGTSRALGSSAPVDSGTSRAPSASAPADSGTSRALSSSALADTGSSRTPTPAASPDTTNARVLKQTSPADSGNSRTAASPASTGASRAVSLDPALVTLEMLPFVKLRSGGRTRRFEVLPAGTARELRDPAVLDSLAMQRLLAWLGANRAAWTVEPASFTLNLSIATLEDEGFLKQVAAGLQSNGVAPDTVGFEIAEPLCTQRRAQVERFIAACDKLGCFVVIDDFSFDSAVVPLLRSKALRLVKIDARLTSAALRDKLSQAMVVAVVQAVKVLGMHCAAQQVDSQAALQWLTAVGCDFAQGPMLARQQPLDKLLGTAS